jgi:hypothetical protein
MEKDKILVAHVGDSKVYYVPGTKAGEKDGVISSLGEKDKDINVFSFLSKTSGIVKLSHTPFHRFFWDGDSDPKRKTMWKEVFILKIDELPKEMMSGVIPASVGKTNMRQHRIDKKASNFLDRDFHVKTQQGITSSRIIRLGIEKQKEIGN